MRHNQTYGSREVRLAILLLLPWVVLTLTSGGIHAHSARSFAMALTPGAAAPAAAIPDAAPRLQGGEVASKDTTCAACLWQLHASVSLPHLTAAAGALPAAPCVSTCPAQVSAAGARSFDPRAPPLS